MKLLKAIGIGLLIIIGFLGLAFGTCYISQYNPLLFAIIGVGIITIIIIILIYSHLNHPEHYYNDELDE